MQTLGLDGLALGITIDDRQSVSGAAPELRPRAMYGCMIVVGGSAPYAPVF
jgi:hypothetical protein